MKSDTWYATVQHFDSAYRPDTAVNRDDAVGTEPRAEFYGYPFICGFSMWTQQEAAERP